MKTFVLGIAAVFAASTALACGCDYEELFTVFASEEDPLVEPGHGVHSAVTMIYLDAGDCVLVSELQPGETEPYRTERGTYLKFRVADAVNEMTLDELYVHARNICSGTNVEAALN